MYREYVDHEFFVKTFAKELFTPRMESSKAQIQKDFSEWFKKAIAGKGTQVEVAALLGTYQENVSRWKSGRFAPNLATMREISRKLKSPLPPSLLGLEDHSKDRTPSALPTPKNLRTVPLVGVAAAGEAMAKLTVATDIPWFSFSEDFLQPMFRGRMDPERAILMRVEGDSMEGDLPHGSLVFIDRGPFGQGLTEVNDEDIYLVQPPDEEGLTLKRVSVQGRGQSKIIMLMPSGLALNRYRVKPYSLAQDSGLTIQSVVRGKVVGRFEYVGRSAPTAK